MKSIAIYRFTFVFSGAVLLVVTYFANSYRIDSGAIGSRWLIAVSQIGFALGYYLLFLGLIGTILVKKWRPRKNERDSLMGSTILFLLPVLIVAII
jgi:hypothetical protein